MAMSTMGIIGAYLLPIFLIILSTVFLVIAILVMIKANKALSIWIRKNDDTQPPLAQYPVPPVPTDSNENSI